MKILVTGGAGFLGSHLVNKLVQQNHHIYCLDNFSTGRRKNIEHLLDQKNFELVIHDIVEPFNIDVDEIYNFACPASPKQYQIDPVKTMQANILGSLNMLELAKKTGAKILQASTSEIYGDPEVHPQTEKYWGRVNPIGIRSCYDEGKRSAETLFFDYMRQYQVRIKLIRIFNTYGPNMADNDGRVVSNFITQALANNPIVINGNGNQTRSFCYVSDLINAVVATMNTSDNVNGPINIGNPEEITIKQLANQVIQITNSNSEIVYDQMPQDDPIRRKPDIALAKELLNWTPTVNLTNGLKKTIEYFKQVS
jgi:UDP-glucuronate decarboxylase